MSDVALAIRLTADADDAVRAAEDVSDSWARMAADVDDATRDADRAADRLGSAADSADNMASSSSQAAGGLGDLGGALALMPGPLGAVGSAMEATAPAIMGVTGAGDLMNLMLRNQRIQAGLARVAAIRHAVVTRTQAVALRVAAVAQRVFNAAMRANPIGLVITAILLVAGAFVLAYRRSETFRNIVNAVMDRVRAAVGWFIDKVKGIPEAFAAARDKVSEVVARIREWMGDVADKVRSAGDTVRSALGGAFDWVMDKVQPIIDAVQWIIDKLQSIDLPDLNPFRTIAGGAVASTAGGDVFHFTFNGITPADEDALARMTERAMAKRRRSTGGVSL